MDDAQPLVLVEIRHVGGATSTVPGAQTSLPAPFLLHAVAPSTGDGDQPAVDTAFDHLLTAAAGADTGRCAAAWMDGAPWVPDALPPDRHQRTAATADAVDPSRAVARSRPLA